MPCNCQDVAEKGKQKVEESLRFLERCPFSEEEIEIFDLRRKGYSITQIAIKLNICDRTVSKRINSICKKILKEI